MKLKLHKIYAYEVIEKLADTNLLQQKVNGELYDGLSDELIGEIGEITMPLYFEDGSTSCNFILSSYGGTSYWRCIYTCASLSHTNKEEI